MADLPSRAGEGLCWGKLPPAVFLGGLWGYGGPEEVVGPVRLRVGGKGVRGREARGAFGQRWEPQGRVLGDLGTLQWVTLVGGGMVGAGKLQL